MNDKRRTGKNQRRGQKKSGGGKIAGHGEFAAFERGMAFDANGAAFAHDLGAEFFERQFGVIARGNFFDHGSDAVGEQAGEQHGGFHLRAGYRQFVFNRAQRPAFDFQRSLAAFARANPCSHLRERIDDAPHRSAA
jgi:hypothetical protein